MQKLDFERKRKSDTGTSHMRKVDFDTEAENRYEHIQDKSPGIKVKKSHITNLPRMQKARKGQTVGKKINKNQCYKY